MGRPGRVGALLLVAMALAAMLAPAAGAQSPQADPRAEASALARIALDTRAELRERVSLIEGGVERFRRFADRCPALERASTRAPVKDFVALSDAVSVRLLYGPLQGTLDRFAGALEAAAVTDPGLREGVAGWRKTVEILRTYMRLPTPLCAAVRRWARSGYARARAPVNAAALASADRQSERVTEAIDRASRRLRKLGASAGAAKAFTIEGLLEAVFPSEVVDTEVEGESSREEFAEFCRHNPGAC